MSLLTFQWFLLLDLLAPFALRPVLPAPVAGRHARDYYEASAPPDRPWIGNGPDPAPAGCPGHEVDLRMVPTFTLRSIGQGGARLYPGSIATATPQTFTMASPPPELNGFGVERPRPPTVVALVRCTPTQIRQVRAGFAVTERPAPVHSRYTF